MTTPNTLTGLINTFYYNMDVVSREQIGLIPSVSMDAAPTGAAKNQTIRTFVTPPSEAYDIEPGQLPVDDGNQSIGYRDMAITYVKRVPFVMNGEEELALNSASGPGADNLQSDQIQNALRTLNNTVEASISALFYKASRARGPAGSTLFDAANYKDIAAMARILDDNGAPPNDRTLVLNSLATAAFRGNAQNTGANTAGTDSMQRNGVFLDMFGMKLRTSAQIKSQAAGTASGATTDGSAYAIGATVLTLASAGSGTIVPGDVITIGDDSSAESYVVLSGDADVSNGGTITIGAPGLRAALSAATHTITVNASSDKNMAFSRNAIHLVARTPAVPKRGDMARDAVILRDPYSGISYRFALYPGYYQNKFEVSLAWGVDVMKPEHMALLVD